MSGARSPAISTAAPPVRVQVIAPTSLGQTAIAVLRTRGIEAKLAREDARGFVVGDDVVAWALEAPPSGARAKELAEICVHAAEAGRPILLLVPPARGAGRAVIERAAAISYLRVHGAALSHDVDAWLEAVVLLVRFGLPQGPRTAVIAPPGSWLEAQTIAIALEAESNGVRSPLSLLEDPTDVVLYDPSLGTPPRTTPGLHIPIAARAELTTDDEPMLHGARAALGAVTILGLAAERIRVGVGPAPNNASAELAIDAELVERQLKKLERESIEGNIGDHDTKALLKAYGVPITRQAVAQTPSDAVKKARRAGYPVELKPFGRDLPSEPAGCPVEKNLTSDALVRSAFAQVLIAAGRSPTENTYVIVRETPPVGRDVAVSFVKLADLGWTVVLDGVQIAAAPAPLRLVDAQLLAAHVFSTRSSEIDLDRSGLANVMRRASHLVVDLDAKLAGLELPRVVVGGRGARTLVVDAAAELL